LTYSGRSVACCRGFLDLHPPRCPDPLGTHMYAWCACVTLLLPAASRTQAMLSAAREVLMPTTGQPVEIRIGVHTGSVVSGVVGTRMPRFCLFGERSPTPTRIVPRTPIRCCVSLQVSGRASRCVFEPPWNPLHLFSPPPCTYTPSRRHRQYDQPHGEHGEAGGHTRLGDHLPEAAPERRVGAHRRHRGGWDTNRWEGLKAKGESVRAPGLLAFIRLGQAGRCGHWSCRDRFRALLRSARAA
jgi:hypothetical protein